MSTGVLKVLIVVTSHGQLGDTGKPSGYYLPEVTHPYFELVNRGIEVDIGSPKGGKAPMDPRSLNLNDPLNKKFYEGPETRKKIDSTIALKDVKASDYQAILFAGGHGTMFDFDKDPEVKRLIREIYENNGVVSAVCHGPAALVDAKLSDGKFLVDGKNIAAFTNEEETAANLADVMPFLLETALIKNGGKHTKAANFQKHVVVDGRLVTGQNPASAAGVGEEVAKLLLK